MATTADEVWALLGELIESQKETDRRMQETDSRMKLTDLQMQETDRRMQETDRRMQETDRLIKENGRFIKELGKQIGGLGKKFGSFTEGLALPSIERILQERFGMEIISPSVRASKGGQHLEIDVLAYANSDINTAYVVEIKSHPSHPREESIAQLKNLLQKFRTFFPEHKDKKLYGILAAVDWSEDLKQQALREGLYVARIHDEVFELAETPAGFEPKLW
ncbi:DUF3782 domain-containing protein [Synechocystis salina LEGE 06099]|uniref:DUF3782 domain-containing protein n=1 Tax=Synechocystis salina TaxID=945780 RepID=UPI001881B5C8|nr:DUF3782 domain-containing protein [Synechocystis salina]MBE9202971.1 DUF3782 domain-containing protein [Synechocystis salina LEGE 06099]